MPWQLTCTRSMAPCQLRGPSFNPRLVLDVSEILIRHEHLRYRPNGCWDRIFGARRPDEPVTIHLAPHLRGIKRLPAVRRRVHGPLRPTSVQRQRVSLRSRITAIRLQGQDEYAWWFPSADPTLAADVCV